MTEFEPIVPPKVPENHQVEILVAKARSNFEKAGGPYPDCPAVYRKGPVGIRFDFERSDDWFDPQLCVTLEFFHAERMFQHHFGWKFGGPRGAVVLEAVCDWLAGAYEEIAKQNRRCVAVVESITY